LREVRVEVIPVQGAPGENGPYPACHTGGSHLVSQEHSQQDRHPRGYDAPGVGTDLYLRPTWSSMERIVFEERRDSLRGQISGGQGKIRGWICGRPGADAIRELVRKHECERALHKLRTENERDNLGGQEETPGKAVKDYRILSGIGKQAGVDDSGSDPGSPPDLRPLVPWMEGGFATRISTTFTGG